MLAARPPRRHALLRPGRGRQRGAVAARVLVLRAPRGLHHDPAGDGDHLGGHPCLLAQADLRLQGGRATRRSAIGFFSMLVWAHHMFAVGLPHLAPRRSSCSRRSLVAVPTGVKIFNWLATIVAREPQLRHADAVRARLHRRVHDRRAVRRSSSPRSRSTGSSPTRTSSSRTCITCCSAARSSGSSPGLHYWWPKVFGRHARARPWASGRSG